jgi:hypothetical protein
MKIEPSVNGSPCTFNTDPHPTNRLPILPLMPLSHWNKWIVPHRKLGGLRTHQNKPTSQYDRRRITKALRNFVWIKSLLNNPGERQAEFGMVGAFLLGSKSLPAISEFQIIARGTKPLARERAKAIIGMLRDRHPTHLVLSFSI